MYVMSIEVSCKRCGKLFITKPQKRGKVYCSKECRDADRKDKFSGENNPNYSHMIKLTCKQCGKEFEVKPGRKFRKYCSFECASKSDDCIKKGERCNFWKGGKEGSQVVYIDGKRFYDHTITCRSCGKKIIRRTTNKRPPTTCGSEECVSASLKAKRNTSAYDVTVKCEVCGKEVIRKNWSTRRNKSGRFYCSIECRRTGVAKLKHDKKVAEFKENYTERTCLYCGKKFFICKSNISETSPRLYCSRMCAGKDKTGEKNSNWKGGTSFGEYCEKFNVEFKERVRAYYGYTCLICGIKESEMKENLTVHHVMHNKDACCSNSPKLFATVCRACHNKTNGKYIKYGWEEYFIKLINEKYGGKCYYTKEEYKELKDKQLI